MFVMIFTAEAQSAQRKRKYLRLCGFSSRDLKKFKVGSQTTIVYSPSINIKSKSSVISSQSLPIAIESTAVSPTTSSSKIDFENQNHCKR
jgi:hypothetical protein